MWRDYSLDDYIDEIAADFRTRANEGIKRYGKSFVGDPLDCLEEEILDSLFYVKTLRRKISTDEDIIKLKDFYMNKVDELKKENAKLKVRLESALTTIRSLR